MIRALLLAVVLALALSGPAPVVAHPATVSATIGESVTVLP